MSNKTFKVTVYTGGFKETIQVEAVNQAMLKQRIVGMGYDSRYTLHKTEA